MAKTNFNGTIDPEPNADVQVDIEDEVVQTCLEMIEDNNTEKNDQDQINEAAIALTEEGFTVEEPDGPRLIDTLKPYQALWKTLGRVKAHDFSIHGTGANESEEKLVTAGVNTVLERSYFLRTLLSKGGVMTNAAGLGDGYWSFSTQQKGFPFRCFPIPNSNIYTDNQATGMRTGAKPVSKLAFIVQMSLGEFNRQYPEFKDKVGVGEIPRQKLMRKDSDQELIQNIGKDKKNFVEVCFYFDIANIAHAVFAGPGCTLIKKETDDDYPYRFDNDKEEELYIPVFNFIGMQSLQGFHNHGILHAVYKRAVASRRLENKTALHIEDNADPIHFMSVGQGQSDKVMQAIETAAKIRAEGGKPLVPLERQLGDPNNIGSVTLLSQGDVAGVEYIQNRWDLDLKRLGIHLDEPETSGTTATEILSEEENANMFVKLMMKINAPEFEFFLRVVLDLLKKTVSKKDKTPLNITTAITVVDKETGEDVEVRPDNATLGLVKTALSEKHYFPRVNAESGYIAPKMRAAQIARGLSVTAPGTPEHAQLLKEYYSYNDLDVKAAPQMGTAPEGTTENVEEAPVQQATERASINPRLQEQLPVI